MRVDFFLYEIRKVIKKTEIFRGYPCTDFEKWCKLVGDWDKMLIVSGSIYARRNAFRFFEVVDKSIAG